MENEVVLKQIENPNQDIVSIVSEEELVFFEITNFNKEREIGLYLKKSNRVGTADYPADKEPYVDIVDILKSGKNQEGLYVYLNENKIFFEKSRGSRPSNKISLGKFSVGEKRIIKLGMDRINSISSRRFFIDLVAE